MNDNNNTVTAATTSATPTATDSTTMNNDAPSGVSYSNMEIENDKSSFVGNGNVSLLSSTAATAAAAAAANGGRNNNNVKDAIAIDMDGNNENNDELDKETAFILSSLSGGPIVLFLDALGLQKLSAHQAHIKEIQKQQEEAGGEGILKSMPRLTELLKAHKRDPHQRDWYVVGLEAMLIPCEDVNNYTREVLITTLWIIFAPFMIFLISPILILSTFCCVKSGPIVRDSVTYGDVLVEYEKILKSGKVDHYSCWILSFSRWPSKCLKRSECICVVWMCG
jgi:hypothetical protein